MSMFANKQKNFSSAVLSVFLAVVLVGVPLYVNFYTDHTVQIATVESFGGGGGDGGGDGGGGDGGDGGGDDDGGFGGGGGDDGGSTGDGSDGGFGGGGGDDCGGCGDDSTDDGFGGGGGDDGDTDGGFGGGGGDDCGDCGGDSTDDASEPDDSSEPEGDSDPQPDPAPVCDLSINPSTVTVGESATLTWSTSNASSVTLNGNAVSKNGSQAVSPNSPGTYTYTIVANGLANSPTDSVDCVATLIVTDVPTPAVCDSFTATPATFNNGTGGQVTLNWETTNADSVSINNGVGTVAVDGNTTTNVTKTTTFTLTAASADGNDTCQTTVTVNAAPTPAVCDSFTATPATFNNGTGGQVTLNWETTNADSVSINNGVGTVAADGSKTVNVTQTTTFTLTATSADGNDTCQTKVTVNEPDTVPECTLSASPSSLPFGGGSVALTWTTTNASSVSINQGIGSVDLDGSTNTTITNDTTFTLTAIDGDGDEETCVATVTVADPVPDPITCEDNVNFTASDTRIAEGDKVTLNWSTDGGINSVSINNGINSTALSGSESINLNKNTTFTLTASDGTDTINCPLSITVDKDDDDDDNGGGGGGGSIVAPRCELTASARAISRGEEVTLTWDTRSAADVTLYDDTDEVIFTTKDYLHHDKQDFLDYSLTVSPTRTTQYTLVAERGSRDVECRVTIQVGDGVVVSGDRGQVAGIALSQTPYTGFEAGTVVTFLFYGLLTLWALVVAYVLVLRRGRVFGFSLPGGLPRRTDTPDMSMAAQPETEGGVKEEESPAAAYVAATAPTVAAPVATQTSAPVNLPTGGTQAVAPVVGYAAYSTQQTTPAATPQQSVSGSRAEVVKAIEDRAHAQYALLSSDAISHLLNRCAVGEDPHARLDEVIVEAKKYYPTEDGWVVVNMERMQQLCAATASTSVTAAAPQHTDDGTPETTPETPATEPAASFVPPQGSGSLAEAIVTGNIAAAYQLIGNRPMVALAEATADLDAAYRYKRGEQTVVSDLLASSVAAISIEQLQTAINALMSALDGTYTNEGEAVKIAILKATKAVN